MQFKAAIIILFFLLGLSMTSASIKVQPWGKINNEQVKLYTLTNDKEQQVEIINYGATIRAIRTPDKNGKFEDVVLGFDNIEGYVAKDNPYFGATIGRVANRIGNGEFRLNNKVYILSKNVGNDTLHGGVKGWNSKIWESDIQNNSLVMTLLSNDKDEGFPGAVIATTIFKLTNDGELIIEMKACTTKATPINLTNHSYFNLAGQGTNSAGIYQHSIMINADYWTVTNADSIPTGEIRSVDNSIMDLRKCKIIGDVINKVPGGGYDYNFCLSKNNDKTLKEIFVASVIHPESGRTLEVYTNQPGVQFYTANYLPDTNTSGIIGKDGKIYSKHGALCLETQNYPDAVNHDNFPNSIVNPGDVYKHIVTYKFGVKV